MAITIPILTEFADKGIVAAQASFANFKTKIGEADGAMGKFKAAGSAAFDTIKANAGAMALGAGTAIAGFALKAINQFQDLALEVDKFSNSTGLATEESSRWIEVAGDIGIESGTLLTAFNKLNRAVASGSTAFQDLGVEIVRTSSGATDVNATFLATVEALRNIKDPAERARLATQVLGKSWTDLSELVQMGSDELSTALGEVAGAKIIDEAEIQKAKDLRAAQDGLSDALDELTLTIGQNLIPAFTSAVAAAKPFLEVVGFLTNATLDGSSANKTYAEDISNNNVQMNLGMKIASKLFGVFGIGTDETEKLDEATLALNEAWIGGYRAMIDARGAAEDLGDAFLDVNDALAELKGNVDERQAWRNLQDEFDRTVQSAITAFTEGTPEAIRDSEESLDRLRLKVGEYIAQQDTIPTEKKTEFLALLDTASVQEIEAILKQLTRPRTIKITTTVDGVPVGPGETPSEVRRSMSTMAFGPGSSTSSGNNINVTVQGSVMTEADLVETLRKGLVTAQRNGSQLVYSNT